MEHRYTNHLASESSPYLLQHQHNPVNWFPWGEEALNKAKEENKLLLISVGYSACHWCHVMEKESFENEEIAAIMNDHFVCIKVDREERPDTDDVYMTACQVINGSGGWPMNCFALTGNEDILAHINNSLEKMAFGGIYDQIGGGFARYSTDEKWKVPHFEKMLYDNAQLVELYSEAYQLTAVPLYQQIVYETLKFIEREMTHLGGGYYSAYDADSEGEEGKYYVWSMEEITEILGSDSELFNTYFSVQKNGNWELDNILFTNREQIEKVQQRFKLDSLELQNKVNQLKSKLLTEREKRIKGCSISHLMKALP